MEYYDIILQKLNSRMKVAHKLANKRSRVTRYSVQIGSQIYCVRSIWKLALAHTLFLVALFLWLRD